MSNPTIIIADDLTGANDTALQYFKNGNSAKIIIDCNQDFLENENAVDNVDIWAVTTESRNIGKEEALESVLNVCEKLKTLNIENYYKKIDSTLRGHVGLEILTILEKTKKEAAIIAPSYIEENRTTIGSYQLLNGMVIDRTQCALDPKAPIYESFIPDILKREINSSLAQYIDFIGLNVITKGAGPIILKLKELISKGKKLIVMDSMSQVDLEQIALAIKKSGFDILPCGSAGLANAINKINDETPRSANISHVPKLPRLIISGSATNLTTSQIQKLKEEKPDILFVDLTVKDIVEGIDDDIISQIVEKLNSDNDVAIHSSDINKELDEQSCDILIDAGIAKDEFSGKITDYLAEITAILSQEVDFNLIIVGGETSYKCAMALNSKYLEIMDAIMPAIPLCMDAHGKIIATKSGNFGSVNTLVEIINYFEKLG